MNILNKIGLRTLKKNMRRTLATILGVVFSALIISLLACVYCLFIYSLNLEEYRQTPMAIFSLIYAFVCVSVIAMLYNSFSISITERIPHLGLLSAIGASPRQLYKSIISESLFIGFIGVPIGSILGVLAYITLCMDETGKSVIRTTGSFLNIENVKLQEAISNLYDILLPDLIIIMAAMIIVIIIAADFVAKRFLKMKTIDALRTGKLIRKKVKPSVEKEKKFFELKKQAIKKIFGIGGVIAYISYSRNKSWHRSLQKPLIISITVFAIVNGVMSMLISNLKSVERDYNISLSLEEEITNVDIDANEQRQKFSELDKCVREYCANSEVKSQKVETCYMAPTTYALLNGELREIDLRFLDMKTFQKLTGDFSAYEGSYYDNDTPKALICNGEKIAVDNNCEAELYISSQSEDDKSDFDLSDETLFLKSSIVIGDSISAQKCEFEIDESAVTLILPYSALETIGTLSSLRFYLYNESNQKTQFADVKAMANELLRTYNKQTEIYINEMKLNGMKDRLCASTTAKGDAITITITNRDEQYQEAQKINEGIKFLTPLFSALVLIVTVANIINTVHHNMIIRRRHFAVYKSIGMNKMQKQKMLMFECVWNSLQSFFHSVPIIVLGVPVAVVFLSYTAAYQLTRNQSDSVVERIKAIITMNDLWNNLFVYLIIISAFVLIVFVISTAIADKIIDDGEIIPMLKSD